MKKGQLSIKQLNRFPILDKFVIKHRRLPKHFELAEMFQVKSGGTTFDVMRKYNKSKVTCLVCGGKLNEKSN